uniref:Nidogen G2 beta-barrel domain-containing protein n=1 Tax=Timema monikensis TaxID=170555 RepID=A0A7R9HNW6_9NEOP|nr:unnamed protein product [Timema monikensis]
MLPLIEHPLSKEVTTVSSKMLPLIEHPLPREVTTVSCQMLPLIEHRLSREVTTVSCKMLPLIEHPLPREVTTVSSKMLPLIEHPLPREVTTVSSKMLPLIEHPLPREVTTVSSKMLPLIEHPLPREVTTVSSKMLPLIEHPLPREVTTVSSKMLPLIEHPLPREVTTVSCKMLPLIEHPLSKEVTTVSCQMLPLIEHPLPREVTTVSSKMLPLIEHPLFREVTTVSCSRLNTTHDALSIQVNTFQVVICSDGEDSYVQFLYADGGIQWIQSTGQSTGLPDARAQAGLMSGDGRLFTLRGSGTDQIQNLDNKLRSDRMKPRSGDWAVTIYFLQEPAVTSLSSDSSVEQHTSTRHVAVPCRTDGTRRERHTPRPGRNRWVIATWESPYSSVTSQSACLCLRNACLLSTHCPYLCPPGEAGKTDSCTLGKTLCHSKSHCVDHVTGFCCHCHSGYYGNGFNCLKEGIPLRVNGKVSGIVNGQEFSQLDLQSYVVTSDGRTYTAISRVQSTIGYDMQTLNVLGGVIGGVFNHTADISFPLTGNDVVVRQRYLGLDVFDQLKMEAEIQGSLPTIPVGTKIQIPDYEEQYMRTEPEPGNHCSIPCSGSFFAHSSMAESVMDACNRQPPEAALF